MAKLKMLLFIALVIIASVQGQCSLDDSIGCFVQGECRSSLVLETIDEETAVECADNCKASDDCEYFTFHADTGMCDLLCTCSAFSEDCDACTSGDRSCPTHLALGDAIFVAGGKQNIDYLDTAEMLRLTESDERDVACPAVPELPDTAESMVAVADQNGNPVFCGGSDNFEGSLCFTYDLEGGGWSEGPEMVEWRIGSATVRLPNGEFWITGGVSINAMTTSEFYDGTTFREGPELPFDMDGHCAVMYQDWKVLLLDKKGPMLADLEQDPDNPAYEPLFQPNYPREYAACWSTTSEDGSQRIMVAGGRYSGSPTDSVEYYDLGTGQWAEAQASLPRPLDFMAYLPYGKNSVVLIGGLTSTDASSNTDEILRYSPEDGEWNVLSEHISIPSHGVAVVYVDPGACPA